MIAIVKFECYLINNKIRLLFIILLLFIQENIVTDQINR